MKKALSFDDVLITPKFSTIKSRKDVDLTSMGLKLPVISSNMDTVTDVAMCKAMNQAGAIGALHRFWSIEDNVKAFKQAECKPWVSIGLGDTELQRAYALLNNGAEIFVLDVAHGASSEVLNQVRILQQWAIDKIIVGNFANGSEVSDFNARLVKPVYAYKVGIGGGSACTTRIKTGCGVPTFTAVQSCRGLPVNIIADGGMRTPGDIAKALAAGANLVMLGGMLAGTTETPGDIIIEKMLDGRISPALKKYRGSASKESYEVQGKDESWRTAEGESFLVQHKGSVVNILQDIEGGLRSALSYVGASTIKEFHDNAEFIEITSAGIKESGAHGKQ